MVNQAMTKKSVILVDDHALFRAGLRSLIEDMPDYEVVAEADRGDRAAQLVGEYRPNLLVLDIAMPGVNGLDALPAVKKVAPGTHVLMVSMYGSTDIVMRAMRGGADGYLLKDAAATELTVALDALSSGIRYLSPAVPTDAVDDILVEPVTPASSLRPGPSDATQLLTPRQTEILKLVASGLSMKEIAHQLSLSVKTVEAHRAQIMERLGLRNLPQLVLYAVRHGLVSPEPF